MKLSLAAIMGSVAALLVAAAAPPKAIIFILADDFGHYNSGIYNDSSPVPTPNLRALANRGVILKRVGLFAVLGAQKAIPVQSFG
jgi:hypothetical protein